MAPGGGIRERDEGRRTYGRGGSWIRVREEWRRRGETRAQVLIPHRVVDTFTKNFAWSSFGPEVTKETLKKI